MGMERVAEKLAGRVTVWGELDRQYTMPSGTSDEVRREASLLKKILPLQAEDLSA